MATVRKCVPDPGTAAPTRLPVPRAARRPAPPALARWLNKIRNGAAEPAAKPPSPLSVDGAASAARRGSRELTVRGSRCGPSSHPSRLKVASCLPELCQFARSSHEAVEPAAAAGRGGAPAGGLHTSRPHPAQTRGQPARPPRRRALRVGTRRRRPLARPVLHVPLWAAGHRRGGRPGRLQASDPRRVARARRPPHAAPARRVQQQQPRQRRRQQHQTGLLQRGAGGAQLAATEVGEAQR